jgi:hypothetical protein
MNQMKTIQNFDNVANVNSLIIIIIIESISV